LSKNADGPVRGIKVEGFGGQELRAGGLYPFALQLLPAQQ
jgi:hypothetical protein